MTKSGDGPLRKSDLYYSDRYQLRTSGIFQFPDATYQVAFTTEAGVVRCLDTMFACPEKSATPRLGFWPENYHDKRPRWPICALRFDYDTEHQVGAAVLLALDKDTTSHAWMTRGGAGRDDVFLTHDTWTPDERRFPPESFITLDELKVVVAQWAFGDELPPPAVTWDHADHQVIGWS